MPARSTRLTAGLARAVACAALLASASLVASCKGDGAHAQTRAAADGNGAGDGGHGPDAGPPVVRVDPGLLASGSIALVTAARRPLSGDLRLPAEVMPDEASTADVGALVSGRLGTLEVRDGDTVKKSQVLGWVDSPEAARAVADVIRSRARAIGASRKLDRQLALEQDRATSPAAVDEARTELALAEADAAAARTLITSLGIPEPPPPGPGALAARVPVRSPIDGMVVGHSVMLGAPVTPDKTLFRVVAVGRMLAEARWTDATTPPPPNGTPVQLLPRSGDAGAGCPGHVTATVAQVDEGTRARRVRVVPDGACPMLVAGAYLDVALTSASLPGGAAPALAVPKEAVVDLHGAPTVFVAGREKGTFNAHVVRTGRVTTADIAIDEGISEGDRVASTGAVLLKGELLKTELESP